MNQNINTSIDGFIIRFASENDVPLILEFIKGLADYEQMSDMVVATVEGLRESLFVKKQAEVIIGEFKGTPIGFALFFHNYSTFLGKANLYLEDLFILKEHRHKGYGKMMLSYLANIAVSRNCSRFDWTCLNWNQPSIDFYKKLGAKPLESWMIFRLTGDALFNLSSKFKEKSE
jgi:GNAT superfamily N-acetyltransferase